MSAIFRLPDRRVPPDGTERVILKFLLFPDYAKRKDGLMEWRWFGFQRLSQRSDGYRWWNSEWIDGGAA